MRNQNLFNALQSICGFTALEGDMDEIKHAVRQDEIEENEETRIAREAGDFNPAFQHYREKGQFVRDGNGWYEKVEPPIPELVEKWYNKSEAEMFREYFEQQDSIYDHSDMD